MTPPPRVGAAGPAGPNVYGQFPIVQVERRINALAVAWLVYAGLIAITGLVGLTVAQGLMTHMRPWQHGMWHAWEGPFMPGFFLRFAWLAVGLRLALALAAGYGLLHKARWGRAVAIVAAILSLIHLPFGTVMAVWTLVVMLSAPNVMGWEMMARD